MAKRRTSEQIKSDRIIKKELLKLGNKILEVAVPDSRRDTGRLQDEMNFRVYSDVNLEMSQLYYGAFNYPAGQSSGRQNALLIAIDELRPEATKIIIDTINDLILAPFKEK
jgi:hypothetical protein